MIKGIQNKGKALFGERNEISWPLEGYPTFGQVGVVFAQLLRESYFPHKNLNLEGKARQNALRIFLTKEPIPYLTILLLDNYYISCKDANRG